MKMIFPVLGLAIFAQAELSCSTSKKTGADQQSAFINPTQVRAEIEAMGRQFSEDFRNQDSLALAAFYTPDGMLGTVKGRDKLVSAFHHMIQNAVEKETPYLLFKTSAITTDEEFVIELGKSRWANKDGKEIRGGKYVVVWKKLEGQWKIFRDWGL